LLSALVHFFEDGRWGSVVETAIEGQSLTAEGKLFILMQAGLYLTATRGMGAPETRICYERAEPLCHALNRPRLLYTALMGQWRYSLMTDKLSATMQIAKRIYSLAQERDDPALTIGACQALASTFFWLGDFESTRKHAMDAVEVWHSGGVQSPVEQFDSPVVVCLCYKALSDWHFGEIASCHALMDEAISIAKELKDRNALAMALHFSAYIAHYDRKTAEVERLASDLIELSTHHHFALWQAMGAIWHGWARSASGDTAEGIPWIEQGIRDYRAIGSVLGLPRDLAKKAEALYLADRTFEAFEAINEAEAIAERFEYRYFSAELHRLRGVFLAAMGADKTQIEASFCEAVRIARGQKSVSLERRAEATYAGYRRQKASTPAEHGFRLPLW
jgi:adenylate cyclase